MKKIVIALLAIGLLAIGLLAGGLWWLIQKKPGAVPPGEENTTVFHMEAVEHGTAIRYEDPQTPLRALRWLPPLPGGLLIVQVVTQSDRQEVSIVKNGTLQATYLVPKPAGVRDGFFRLAELRDAVVVEGDVAVLLFTAPGTGTDEWPLVVALDLNTKDIRWFHRALGERLALTEGSDRAVYLYGPKTPPVRLPLAVASSEHMSPTGARSTAKTIELPPEITEISDLKPTGPWTFLLAHRDGLSAYLGSKGWEHHPLPEGNPGFFKDVLGVLAGGGKKLWWQPFPGTLLQILPDGTPRNRWTPEALAAAEPYAKDAALLHLLGADADGKLWFDLAVPAQEAPAAAPATDPQWKPETPASGDATAAPAVLEDWPAYVNQGLDRIYCWDNPKGTLQRYRLSALAVPQGFQKPTNGTRLNPASGMLLLENGPSAWLLPLSGLALGEPAGTGKPTQVK